MTIVATLFTPDLVGNQVAGANVARPSSQHTTSRGVIPLSSSASDMKGIVSTWNVGMLSRMVSPADSSTGWTSASNYNWAWLSGASCPTTNDCTSVGGYNPESSVGGASVVDFTNGSAGPLNYYESPILPGSGYFSSISCAAVGTCTAVGVQYEGSSGGGFTFEPAYAQEVKGVWGLPETLATPAGASNDAQFTGVSCPDVNTCVATGVDQYAENGYSVNVPMYDVAVDGAWGPVTELPSPTGNALLFGISCSDDNDCTTVGEDFTVDTACPACEPTLVEVGPIVLSMTDGTWTSFEPSAAYPPGVNFEGVSCTDATDCTAVGQAWVPDGGSCPPWPNECSGSEEGAIATEQDGVWSSITAAGTSAWSGISCVSIGNCTAVGWDEITGEPAYSNEAAGIWGSTVDVPTQVTAFFYSVSCADAPTTETCVAGGEAEDGSFVGGPLPTSDAARVHAFAAMDPVSGGSSGAKGAVLMYETISRLPSAPNDIAVSPEMGKLVVSWKAPQLTGSTRIRSYTVTASSGELSATCTTTKLTCTVGGLSPHKPYGIKVRASNGVGEGPAAEALEIAYPVVSRALKVIVLPTAVQVGQDFTLLAYGAGPGSNVKFTEEGNKYACTMTPLGQCYVSATVGATGRWKATAAVGKHAVSATFYAPAVVVPSTVPHGSDIKVSVSSAPPGCSISVWASGKTYTTKASRAGKATVKIKTSSAGSITVRVTIDGSQFAPQSVDVT